MPFLFSGLSYLRCSIGYFELDALDRIRVRPDTLSCYSLEIAASK